MLRYSALKDEGRTGRYREGTLCDNTLQDSGDFRTLSGPADSMSEQEGEVEYRTRRASAKTAGSQEP